MKLDYTKLIQTAMVLIVVLYAIGEFSPVRKNDFVPVAIDSTIAIETNKRINYLDSLITVKDKFISDLQRKRNNVPKEVAAYSDSDLTVFSDSFGTANGVNGRIIIQALHH